MRTRHLGRRRLDLQFPLLCEGDSVKSRVGDMVYTRPWDVCEDERLRVAVRTHGRRWEDVSGDVPGRSAESCRIRWRKIRGAGAGGGLPPVALAQVRGHYFF